MFDVIKEALGLTAAIVGLVFIYINPDRHHRRILIAIIAVSALLVLSAIGLFNHLEHKRIIDRCEKDILSTLSDKALTFDELYQRLHFWEFSTINEALFQAVRDKDIGHRVTDVRIDSDVQGVRRYYKISR